MKKRSLAILLICQLAFLPAFYGQNIAINEAGSLPDTSAMLDVSSSTKGFLTPRMTTTQQNAIPVPANGLLIYNTTDNTFKVNKGTPASPNWSTLGAGAGSTTNTAASSANTLTTNVNGVSATAPMINTNVLTLTGTKIVSTINGIASDPTDLISMQNVAWNLTGNAGTTPATHFLGTTDNNDFIFKTNSIEAMRLTGPGRLLGLNVSNPIYRIQVEDPSGPDADIAARMYNTSNQNFFPSLQLQVSAGTHNSPLPVTNGTILGVLHFVGFDGAGFSDVISTGIEVKTSENWNPSSHGAYMYFKTTANGTNGEAERMRIDQNGYVGIGTSYPGSALDVRGALRLSGSSSGYVGFAPPASAGSTTYTLPATDGSNGQSLVTNGSAVLSWSSAAVTKLSDDVNPKLGSTLLMNDKSIDMTAALAANQSFAGLFENAVAGEAVAFGDVLYLDFSTAKWKKAKADAVPTTPAQRIALENIAANATGKMLIEGFIRNDSWSFSAAPVYLGTAAAGALTNTAPVNPGEQVQRLGIALGSSKLHFRPALEVKGL